MAKPPPPVGHIDGDPLSMQHHPNAVRRQRRRAPGCWTAVCDAAPAGASPSAKAKRIETIVGRTADPTCGARGSRARTASSTCWIDGPRTPSAIPACRKCPAGSGAPPSQCRDRPAGPAPADPALVIPPSRSGTAVLTCRISEARARLGPPLCGGRGAGAGLFWRAVLTGRGRRPSSKAARMRPRPALRTGNELLAPRGATTSYAHDQAGKREGQPQRGRGRTAIAESTAAASLRLGCDDTGSRLGCAGILVRGNRGI